MGTEPQTVSIVVYGGNRMAITMPTYHVTDTVSFSEVQVHAQRRFAATGVKQRIVRGEMLIDIVGCQHDRITKHYGRPLVCDECHRFKDESGEWRIRQGVLD